MNNSFLWICDRVNTLSSGLIYNGKEYWLTAECETNKGWLIHLGSIGTSLPAGEIGLKYITNQVPASLCYTFIFPELRVVAALYLKSTLILCEAEWDKGSWVTHSINIGLFCHSSPLRFHRHLMVFRCSSEGKHTKPVTKWFAQRGHLNMKCQAIFKGSGAHHSVAYCTKWKVARLDIC